MNNTEFLLKSVEVEQTSKALAKYISGLRQVPGERRLTASRLAALKKEIEDGRDTPFIWVVAEVEGQGEFRINGQHTSHLFANGVAPVGNVILQRYFCKSVEGAISLWARYDAQVSSRTKNDVMRTAFENDDDLAVIPSKIRNQCANAIALIAYGPGYTNKVSNIDKATLAVKFKAFICWMHDLLKGEGATHKRNYSKVGLIVAAFQTWLVDPQAEVFWKEVFMASNPNPNSPSRQLERWVLENAARSPAGAQTGKRMLSWDEWAEKGLAAWTAWRAGKKETKLRGSKSGLARFMEIPDTRLISGEIWE